MHPVEVPEFPTLRGEEAIETLCSFVSELEEQRGKELTEKQTRAMIKFAWGLVSSIEAEMRLDQTRARIVNELCEQMCRETRFVTHLKKTITKHIPESLSQALRLP